MLWLLLGVGTALGLMLVGLGLTGRRINDHPICRACGFDLRGSGDEPAACSECGADLTRRRAITQGLRRRSGRLVGVGGLVLVAFVALQAIVIWSRVVQFDWTPVKPGWWLVAEARGGDGDALDELLVRLQGGELSPVSAAFLVDRALEEQVAENGAWFGTWDRAFEAAWQGNVLTTGQLETFAKQVLPLELWHRDSVRRESPWRMAQAIRSVRATPTVPLGRYALLERLEVGGVVVYEKAINPERIPSTSGLSARASVDWVMRTYQLPPLEVEEGTHEVRGTFFLVIADHRTNPPTRILADRILVTSTIEVTSPASAPIALIHDDSLAAQVRAAVQPRSLQLIVDPGDFVHTWSAIDLMLPPVDLAFDVSLRRGDREWPVGSIAAAVGTRDVHSIGGFEFPLTGLDPESPDPIDLVLRPSPEACERLSVSQVERVWGEDVVLEDVAVDVVDRRP